MRTNKKTEDEKIFGLFFVNGCTKPQLFSYRRGEFIFFKTGPHPPFKIHMGEDNVIFLKYGYQKADFLGNVSRGS